MDIMRYTQRKFSSGNHVARYGFIVSLLFLYVSYFPHFHIIHYEPKMFRVEILLMQIIVFPY